MGFRVCFIVDESRCDFLMANLSSDLSLLPIMSGKQDKSVLVSWMSRTR